MTRPDRQVAPGARLLPAILFVLLLAMAHSALVRRPLDEGGSGGWPDMRIDLNIATADELQVLPRIGPSLAARIVADRQACGPFATLEDVDRVPQIGPAVIESIRPYVVVESAADDRRSGIQSEESSES